MSYQELAYAVVEQAVEDYKEKKALGEDVSEIEEFLKSKWCDLLLTNTPFSGKGILEALESR